MTAFSIEAALRSHIGSLGFDAYVTVPAQRPSRFVTVERTGGGAGDMIDHPLIAVQCWAATRGQAEEDSRTLRNALLCGPLPAGVYNVGVNAGPYSFPDPDSRSARYQTLYEITCRM